MEAVEDVQCSKQHPHFLCGQQAPSVRHGQPPSSIPDLTFRIETVVMVLNPIQMFQLLQAEATERPASTHNPDSSQETKSAS